MENSLIEEYLQSLILKGLRQDTVEQYREGLHEYESHLAGSGIYSFFAANASELQTYFSAVKEKKLARTTVWRKQHAVYAFYQWLKETQRLILNPCPAVVLEKGRRLPRSAAGLSSLNKVYKRLRCSYRFWEQRDYTIIDLAYTCGLRRGELRNLNVEDINADDGTIRVRGKGDRQRLVPVGRNALVDLLYYVYHIRPKFIKYGRTKAMFVSWINGGQRLNSRSINAMFIRLRKKNILNRRITPHSLRHGFATDLIRNGAPVQDVSKMLGHKKLETTQVYTHLMPVELKKYHGKYHPRG